MRITRSKIIFAILVIIIISGLLVFVKSIVISSFQSKKFVDHWAMAFNRCQTLDGIRELGPEERPDLLYIRKFSNGDWVVGKNEYACTDGAGFDAAIFFGSDKVVRYQLDYHYCGFEGFSNQLSMIKAAGLADFYAQLPVKLQTWSK